MRSPTTPTSPGVPSLLRFWPRSSKRTDSERRARKRPFRTGGYHRPRWHCSSASPSWPAWSRRSVLASFQSCRSSSPAARRVARGVRMPSLPASFSASRRSRSLRPRSCPRSTCPRTSSETSRSASSRSSDCRCSSPRSVVSSSGPSWRSAAAGPGDVGGGFLLGVSLGLLFTPCAGPIIAAVAAVAATERFSVSAVLVTLAYALGAGLVLLGIAIAARRGLNLAPLATPGSARPESPRRDDRRGRRAHGARGRHEAADEGPRLHEGPAGPRGERRRREPDRRSRAERTRARPGNGRARRLRRRARVHRNQPMVQLAAAAARVATGQGRPDRLLDLLLHQLPANAPLPHPLGRDLPRRRARHRRRPHARVRLRARPRERSRGDRRARHQVSGSPRPASLRPGTPGRTGTGRPSTSSTGRATSATPTSARARTRRRKR